MWLWRTVFFFNPKMQEMGQARKLRLLYLPVVVCVKWWMGVFASDVRRCRG
jgi:hypothetical protein